MWALQYVKAKSVAECKTAVSSFLMHWRYCSLALSHWNDYHDLQVNSLTLCQNDWNFADFFSNWCNLIKVLLKFVPRYPINIKSPLVEIMAWSPSATSHHLNQCWHSLPTYICVSPSLNELIRMSVDQGGENFSDAPSQWEMTLHCNVISHWLVTYAKWSLMESMISIVLVVVF